METERRRGEIERSAAAGWDAQGRYRQVVTSHLERQCACCGGAMAPGQPYVYKKLPDRLGTHRHCGQCVPLIRVHSTVGKGDVDPRSLAPLEDQLSEAR